jgi:hypothetical protein
VARARSCNQTPRKPSKTRLVCRYIAGMMSAAPVPAPAPPAAEPASNGELIKMLAEEVSRLRTAVVAKREKEKVAAAPDMMQQQLQQQQQQPGMAPSPSFGGHGMLC